MAPFTLSDPNMSSVPNYQPLRSILSFRRPRRGLRGESDAAAGTSGSTNNFFLSNSRVQLISCLLALRHQPIIVLGARHVGGGNCFEEFGKTKRPKIYHSDWAYEDTLFQMLGEAI